VTAYPGPRATYPSPPISFPCPWICRARRRRARTLSKLYPFAGYITTNGEEVPCKIPRRAIRVPRSHYRQPSARDFTVDGFPVPRRFIQIKISDERLNGLVQRGYLGPNEFDDMQAVNEALSLFLWDKLQKSPKRAPDARRSRPIASKRAKR
jgi:hypothetical protein